MMKKFVMLDKLSMGKDVHVFVMSKDWALLHVTDGLFRVWFGSKQVIVLSDPALVREAFRKEEFCAHPQVCESDDIIGRYGND